MDESRPPEKVVSSTLIHSGSYIELRAATIEDATGQQHRREFVAHPGAVCIVALDGDELLMVRQFRTPIGAALLELPAGTLERLPGGGTEPPDGAAARELVEETGYTARRWRKLGRFFTTPGFTSEEMHLYLAQDLTPVEGYGGAPEAERVDLVRVTRREAVAMADEGDIRDAKSLLGLFWLERLASEGALDEAQPRRESASR